MRSHVQESAGNKALKIAAVAAIATVVGIVVTTLAWLFPDPIGTVEAPAAPPAAKASLQSKKVAEKSVEKRNTGTRGSVSEDPHMAHRDRLDVHRSSLQETLSSPEPTPTPRWPLKIELSDGEQDVILSGQASLAVEFNRIGNEQFVTLRVYAGDTSMAHAVLSPTARYDFELEGQIYYITVLHVDYSGKSARLRVDRKGSL